MSWIELCYSSQDHGYWLQAQYDKRDNIDSPEARSFLWTGDCACPSGGPPWKRGEWGMSKIANCCYKEVWKEPGFDWASADWQAEAASITAHWIDKGLDGMIFDAYNLDDNDWGMLNASVDNQTVRVVPNVQDQWNALGLFIAPEGILDGTNSADAVGPDSDYQFDAVNNVTGGKEKGSWNNDYYDAGSLFVEDGISPEQQFAQTIDIAHAYGGTNYGYDVVSMPDGLRPCGLAIMTTAGVIEELYFSTTYDASCTAAFADIFNAVNSTDALTPVAPRLGVPASGSSPAYAHVKTSTDGLSKALCIFNGGTASNQITVNLSDADIDIPCSTTNLMTGGAGPDITSTSFVVTIEGCGNYGGFLLLDVPPTAPCTATDCHVESLDCGVLGGPAGTKYGQVDVLIRDDCGKPVAGADVTGTFTGGFNETLVETTDAYGLAVFTTTTAIKRPSYQLCVDDVVHTLPYDETDNVATCCTK